MITTKKPRKPIRKQSLKKAAQNRERGKAYTVLDSQWEPGYCQGCGKYCNVIDHSHLLSQKDFPHLAGNKANIVPHCRDCHLKWESPTNRWRLLDFRDNMEFIQRVAPDECRKMLALSEMKIERHFGPEEVEKYLSVIEGFEL